jgi:hypothetical protein
MPLPDRDLSDWEWVRQQAAAEAPIPYDPNDPDDGPYDPNDDAAVEAFVKQATIWKGWPEPVLIQQDGVPVDKENADQTEATHNEGEAVRTKAS